MIENIREMSLRCPRLGSPVRFSYCERCEENGRPCFKVFDCWWELFDVVSHMRQQLTPEAFERLCQKRPSSKIASILDIIQKVNHTKE